MRNKNSKEETKRNIERKQRTIDDERVKENFKNKEVREMEAMERAIEREMREEDERLEERRKKVGIEKVVAEIQREAIDWKVLGDIRREEAELNNRVKEIGIDRTIVEIGEVLRDVRKEGTKLNNRVKEVGIERKIDEIGQRTEIRQEQRSRRRDSDQCSEYAREQIKLKNGKRPGKIIIIGDSLMAHGREHLHNYENKYQQCQRATIGFKRGATLNEIIEEVKAIKSDREGGIIVIQGGGGGGGNNLTQDGAVLQWFKLMECIGEIWRKNEKVTIGIVGITRRMAENREFERQRVRAEDIWSEEIMRWQEERIRNKRPSRWIEGLDFISMERVIKAKDIGRDGVHLNRFGYEKFYDKIFDFVQVTQNLRSKTREEEKDINNNSMSEKRTRGLKRTNVWVWEKEEETLTERRGQNIDRVRNETVRATKNWER